MAENKQVIACIGAGYVGGCTMAVIAKYCPEYHVVVCDIDQKRIDAWNSDNLPIFEPNLLETIKEAQSKNNNLEFTSDVTGTIKKAHVIFVAVSTPTKTYGRGAGKAFDMTSWEAVSRTIANAADSDKVIVEKSTVPVRTAEKVLMILDEAKKDPSIKFQVVSNPEFLAEGSAIKDLENPPRVLIGGDKNPEGQKAVEFVAGIYSHWVAAEKIVTTNLWTSELSKLASNAFLAQRISSINAISAICEESGADVQDLSKVLGMDDRIGSKYLSASVGFGGSCLKKDVLALVYICESYQLYQVADYWRGIVEINEFQKQRFATRVLETMYGTVRNKKLCILGFAFKKNTGDIREASSIEIVQFFVNEAANIHIYDPKVSEHDIKALFPNVTVHTDPIQAMNGSHALVLLTEWDEFRTYDYAAVYETMAKPAFVFDGRNILDGEKLAAIGFHVHSVGKQSKFEKTHIVL